MSRALCILGILLVSAVLNGCGSTADNTPSLSKIAVSQSGPKIVILGQRHVSNQQTETDYIQCLGEDLAERSAPFSIIPEKAFVDAMYPYFERSTAPLHVSNFGKMIQEPAVAQKIEDLDLRYVVWINGKTQKTNASGGVSCAIGPGGGGCLGLATWDDEADYTASVWDINNLSVSGNVSTQKSGTSYLPAVIIPIPILSGVQDNACNDMAIRINQYLTY
jgi:hypothetical protein